MQDFLEAIFTLPTVLFTVPLGLSVIYWLFVVVGAADVDLLGGADGVVEGATAGAVEGGAETGLAWVLSALKLKSAPATVVLSLFSFFGWMLSYVGNAWGWALLGEALPGWAIGALVFVAAFAGSTLTTSLVLRPLAPLFETTTATRGGRHLLGKSCLVRTGRVDGHFGQAELDDGGAGLLLHVRCSDERALKKGDEALIIDYDAQRDVYWVEPMKGLLSTSSEQAERVPAQTSESEES